jgi:hypothetical protein
VTGVSSDVVPAAGGVVTTCTGVRITRSELSAGMDVHASEHRVMRVAPLMTHRVVGQPVESHEHHCRDDQTRSAAAEEHWTNMWTQASPVLRLYEFLFPCPASYDCGTLIALAVDKCSRAIANLDTVVVTLCGWKR